MKELITSVKRVKKWIRKVVRKLVIDLKPTLCLPTASKYCSKNATWLGNLFMSPPTVFTYLYVYAETDTWDGLNRYCLPKNVTLNRSKLPVSAIGRRILDSGHVVDRDQSFKVIARVKNTQLLRFAKASAIRRIKLNRKQFVVHLSLPWVMNFFSNYFYKHFIMNISHSVYKTYSSMFYHNFISLQCVSETSTAFAELVISIAQAQDCRNK